MRLFNRHVGSHVLAAVLLVMVVLAGLFGIAEFADELTDAPEGASPLDVVVYVLLRIPGILLDNLGFAMLLGCLTGLGVLASQSELTVLRASGVSVYRIVWMVLRPMLVLMLVAVAMGEYAVPGLNRYAEAKLAAAGDQETVEVQAFRGNAGLWLRHDQDFLHFNAIQPGGTLVGLSWLRFNADKGLDGVGHAPVARFAEGVWTLEKANVTLINDSMTTAAVAQEGIRWEASLPPVLLSMVVAEPANMSMRELSAYITYLEQQSLDHRSFALAFWQKALRPLGMIGMVLVAISFIFGPLRSTPMGHRLFTGIMVGVVFRFAQDLLGPVSLVFGLSPVIAVGLPILLCWLVGVALLSRVR